MAAATFATVQQLSTAGRIGAKRFAQDYEYLWTLDRDSLLIQEMQQ